MNGFLASSAEIVVGISEFVTLQQLRGLIYVFNLERNKLVNEGGTTAFPSFVMESLFCIFVEC